MHLILVAEAPQTHGQSLARRDVILEVTDQTHNVGIDVVRIGGVDEQMRPRSRFPKNLSRAARFKKLT